MGVSHSVPGMEMSPSMFLGPGVSSQGVQWMGKLMSKIHTGWSKGVGETRGAGELGSLFRQGWQQTPLRLRVGEGVAVRGPTRRTALSQTSVWGVTSGAWRSSKEAGVAGAASEDSSRQRGPASHARARSGLCPGCEWSV